MVEATCEVTFVPMIENPHMKSFKIRPGLGSLFSTEDYLQTLAVGAIFVYLSSGRSPTSCPRCRGRRGGEVVPRQTYQYV